MRPDSGEAWLLLARALGESGGAAAEQEQALVRAAELQPQNPSALNSLAWFYVGRGDARKAAEPAKRAVVLAPGDAAILDTYAGVLFQSGHCPESLMMQRRALDVMHENASERLRKSIQEALDKYERACQQPSGQKP